MYPDSSGSTPEILIQLLGHGDRGLELSVLFCGPRSGQARQTVPLLLRGADLQSPAQQLDHRVIQRSVQPHALALEGLGQLQGYVVDGEAFHGDSLGSLYSMRRAGHFTTTTSTSPSRRPMWAPTSLP